MDDQLYPRSPILMVDDEVFLLKSFELTLNDAGITNVATCNDSREAMAKIAEVDAYMVMLDLSMPHLGGEELLEKIKSENPNIPVVIITGNNEIESAVRCMKNGAFDYLVKPVEDSRLVSSITNAIRFREKTEEIESLKRKLLNKELEYPQAFTKIITQNEKMKSIFQYMEAIAKTSEPILITGETGVGKELIAQSLHNLSERKGKFVTTNVAGLDDQMFSDTLFGHKKGAFTGALSDRAGLIEKASGGTLFLDEIGDLQPVSQVKLLRLLQENEYYPLGADEPKYAETLIVVATNRNLFEMQQKGEFRKDLFYRLNVHRINPIPLRERLDDLPLLVDFFLEQSARTLGKSKPTAPQELVTLLSTYDFPGNIRELQAMIFDAVSTHKSKILSLDSFKNAISKNQNFFDTKSESSSKSSKGLVTFGDQLPTLKQVQNELIDEAMERAKGNQSIAARLLGVTRQALSRRLKNDKDD